MQVTAQVRREATRRLVALIVLAWLNPVAQPGFAAPAMPAAMAHCDHGGTPTDLMQCQEMRADGCAVANDFAADAPRRGPQPRADAIPVLLPQATTALRPSVTGSQPSQQAAGPTLSIRYCKLRN